VKNCHSCDRATDQGGAFKCRFDPRKLLAEFPFYPAFLVKVIRTPVSKDKIPEKDCPAFKPRKQAEKTKGASDARNP
jgi:hypothetical protein